MPGRRTGAVAAAAAVLWASAALPAAVQACTNYLYTPGATEDGSAFISYAADSGALYGTLGHYPAGKHAEGTMRETYVWDTGMYLGQIPEAAETYNVVGNCNEWQLCIGETTFGGLGNFSHQPGALVDYGSLIWITLQRSRNVSEAITTMDAIMQTYGYASNGESFSLADPREVWLMEVMSKGPGERGSVWVARRIPDGYVCGHANQARIRTFPRDDPANCRYAADVLSFAVAHGLYPAHADPALFSFSDTFDPVGFTGARLAEARVWNFFRQVADDSGAFGAQYLDYVQGQNLTHRMPLWVKPYRKLSLNDTFTFMRAHYEGSVFDMRGTDGDVGAGAHDAAWRMRPLYWPTEVGGRQYHNERPIGTQQTAWHFVGQMREWLPDEVGTIVWFSVDDTGHSHHVPVYSASTRVSSAWGDEGIQHVDDEGASLRVDTSKAFWAYNMVNNYVYGRWRDVSPYVAANISAIEGGYMAKTKAMDAAAKALVAKGNTTGAIEALTAFSVGTGDAAVANWNAMFLQLFFRFRDGFLVSPPAKAGPKDFPWPHVQQLGYSDPAWYQRIARDTGDRYLVPEALREGSPSAPDRLNPKSGIPGL